MSKSFSRPLTIIGPRRGWFDFSLREVWQNHELLFFLVWRDLKVRYSQATLGVAWALIQPLVAVAIFTVIFGVFAKLPSDGIPYPVFVFTAMLPWTFFSEAARRSSVGLVGDTDLIKKVYFPRLVIPLANVATPLVDYLVSLLALGLLMIFYKVPLSLNVIFLPILILLTGGLALGVGLFLGPLNVRHRDITHTLPFLLQVWMYATPVVYPLSIVPERFKFVYSLNPMVGIIEAFRWCVLGVAPPSLLPLVVSVVLIFFLLFIGLVWFKSQERNFSDII